MPEWLNRVNSRIRYCLNPKFPDRIQICLSDEDATDIEATIQKRFEEDGVLVEFTRKEYQKYRLERVLVKRSEGERVAASILNTLFPLNQAGLKEDKGSYQNRKQSDGFRYGLSITITW